MIHQKTTASAFICVLSATLAIGVSQSASAQVEAPAAVEIQSLPGGRVIRRGGVRPAPSKPAPKPAQKKPEDEKKPKDDKKEEKKDDEKGEEGTPDTITRPNDPETPPDPTEFELRPNETGKLRLNFTGQPWPAVLEWLKVVSNLTLDWQELPGGYLNLVTHREYTVPEARSLINRHLLARGYTIVINGEIMTVEKIEKLNPAVVPRVTAESLDDRDPYEFVKVSFKLEGMLAEDAATEFAPMKSANGKLTPLSSNNWLEAMDAVINLRDIRDAVLANQEVPEEEQLVRPFYLKHVRAEDIVNPLRELLGMPPVANGGGGGGGGFNQGQMQQFVQQMQQMVQQMQQAAQQNKGGGGASGGRSRRNEKIHIVPVPRDNSLLVSGPPDKLALVENAILILDQAPTGAATALDSLAETEVFRLANLDPEDFEQMLRELGGLSPRTKVQVNKARRTVVVTGPKTDRIIVELMIEKLDGSSRTFQVISLRKHQADYVAGSIRFMMGMEEEDSNNSSSSRRGYFFYPYGGRQQEEDPTDKFRVDADVEYNRLLLWCNRLELEQVKNLLIALGELPVPGGNQNRRRVYEVDSLEEAMNLIDRLEKAWPSRGRNKLDIIPPVVEPPKDDAGQPIGPQAPDKLQVEPADKTASERKANPDPPPADRVAQGTVNTIPGHSRRAQLLGLLSVSQVTPDDSESATDAQPSAPASTSDDAASDGAAVEAADSSNETAVTPMPLQEDDPAARFQRLLEQLRNQRRSDSAGADAATQSNESPIQIRIGPNGEIYLESDDTYALDMIEEVMDEYAPPRRDWKVFELKYPNTWAYGIEVILKDIFKEEMEENSGRGGSSFGYDPWYGMYRQRSSGSSSPRRMSQRKPLKIISDRDSHTILVQGASREQLHMIEEMIAIYDKPESTEAHTIRKTQVFKIQYSTAKVIGDAVKEVYRDLLSENDKALQQEGRGDKDKRPAERSYTYIYGGGGGEGQEKESPIRFKGLLSIGVDPVSNILIVSASEGLLDNVGQIIEALDEAARPNSAYQVMHVDPRVNTRELQQRLSKMFGPKQPQQNQQNQQKNGQPQPGQNRNPQNGQPVAQ